MTEETRRSIFRYGIAVDLVVLATGVGMLLPVSARALIVIYVAAVALSTWKGGWKGGATALVLSLLALGFLFPEQIDAARLVEFTGAAVAAGAIVAAANASSRTRVVQPIVAHPDVVAFTAPIDEEEIAVASQERQRIARRLEETAAQQIDNLRRETERLRKFEEERIVREREAAERSVQEEANRLAEEQRRAAEDEALRLAEEEHRAQEARERERIERHRADEERLAAERRRADEEQAAKLAAARAEAERIAQENAECLLAEQRRAEEELAQQLIREREEAQRQLQERIEAERRAAEEELRHRLEAEREALKAKMEQQLAAEREAIEREAAARVEAARKEAEEEASRRVAAEAPKKPAPRPQPKASILDSVTSTVSGWFQRTPPQPAPKRKNVKTNVAPPRRSVSTSAAPVRRTTTKTAAVRKPRLLMLERRRPTADTILPKLRQRGVEVTVVERWVDAVDEIFRLRPDAIVIDVEHPEFETVHRTITEKNSEMPIVLSGRSPAAAPPTARRAAFLTRPYDLDDVVRLAEKAMSRSEDLLAEQTAPRPVVGRASRPPAADVSSGAVPVPVSTAGQDARPVAGGTPAPQGVNPESYEVACFTCRIPFDAVDADWCSCLAKERTLVCTNCLACFCKAPPSYKEKFWVEAPPRLFERKTSDARRQQGVLPTNPELEDIRRPLVLTVEDDEEIQAIVARVCSNLGYGFIYATNGQDGLDIARAYRPNMILSDAFMPKLDGREMCRILKEEQSFDAKMVVMTGLYTDTKYRSEALKRFHVDDYISKPVAITDLVNLLQKHLEGVTGLPMQEDLHELHRQDVIDADDREIELPAGDDENGFEGIALADLLDTPQTIEVRPKSAPHAAKRDSYEVCCFNCQNNFDATRADWCTCVGRDQTVVCTHCSGCFCKSPAAYKERFWMDAPPMLFERKMLGSKRHHGDRANPVPADVKRPLILLVEDDENVQLIVKTVVTTMGFGFVVGANGQEGLSLAREYNPDLILSDAFMPKLDGREMCRLLKEDPATARSKAIIMTGLYTDRKYRNEALDYFKVDDYVAKPLAVDDLIKLFKKHLPQEVPATN